MLSFFSIPRLILNAFDMCKKVFENFCLKIFLVFFLSICRNKKDYYFCTTINTNNNGVSGKIYAGIAQLVEHNLAKVGVAGPSPVSRSEIPIIGIFFHKGCAKA